MGSKLWSKDDEKRLQKLWGTGLASGDIQIAFNGKYTRAAVIAKLDRMGLLHTEKERIKLSAKVPRWVRELAPGEVQHGPSQGCEICRPIQAQEIRQSVPQARTPGLFRL